MLRAAASPSSAAAPSLLLRRAARRNHHLRHAGCLRPPLPPPRGSRTPSAASLPLARRRPSPPRLDGVVGIGGAGVGADSRRALSFARFVADKQDGAEEKKDGDGSRPPTAGGDASNRRGGARAAAGGSSPSAGGGAQPRWSRQRRGRDLDGGDGSGGRRRNDRPNNNHGNDNRSNAPTAPRSFDNSGVGQRASDQRQWTRQERRNDHAHHSGNSGGKWGDNHRRSSDRINQASQGSSASQAEDLKDISTLRNAFFNNPSQDQRHRQEGRETWRDGNRTNARPAHASPKAEGTAGNVGAGTGTGVRKFTPRHYRKKEAAPATPPAAPPSPSTTSPPQTSQIGALSRASYGSPGVSDDPKKKSLEEVMRNHSARRRETMAQKYADAGERVPRNVDEYGNARGGGYAWRNQRNNESNYRRGGGGGYGRRPRTPRPQMPDRNRGKNDRFDHFGGERARRKRIIQKHLPKNMLKEVRVPDAPVTLVDLSLLLRVRKRTLVNTLRSLGETMSYNAANQDSYTIDPEMVEYVCIELGVEPLKAEAKESSVEEAERRALRRGAATDLDEEAKTEEEERYAALPPRSPVISIMGHVDHGKTTLTDALRRRAVTGDATPKGAGKEGKKEKKKKKDKKGKGGPDPGGDVAGTEAGGITQVVTAFEVPLPLEEDDGGERGAVSKVTILDTPGHAAFKKMRLSGSSATDVIVLVVAADDGISPQTIEILDTFKSIARGQPGSISLVVAVTKVDKPGIDVDEAVMRIENQLMEQEIYTENIVSSGLADGGEFGDCQLFPVSGLTGEGLDDLVEGLAMQSEMMDLRADPDAGGEGIVIDARMEKGLGVVADCVIRWGSVSKGDFVVSGTNGGRVKFLNDVGNRPLKRGMPSMPVRIVGFKTIPRAGDPVVCAASEEEARELIHLRESELASNEDRADFETDVELQVTGTAAKQGSMMQKAREGYGFDDEDSGETDIVRIPVVIKADSHGALDAVRDALVSIGTDSKLDIVIDPVEMSTGVVTSSDVVMARESDAAIFVFGKVGIADKETKNMAESDGVSIRSHDIIYRLLEDAKTYFERYLPLESAEKVHGEAHVQQVFDVTDASKNIVSIAGLRVTEGHIYRTKSVPGRDGGDPLPCLYRVMRKGEAVTDMDRQFAASSLRKVKEDVDSVRHGEECGLGIAGFNDLKEGDVVVCYSIEEKRAKI